MSIRPLLGGCVWKAGPCPEGCKSILSWQKTNLGGILFFFFFSTKESCVLHCEPELQRGGESCKSSSRLERFPLSLLELCGVRAPQCQEQTHHHHRVMQTRCSCNLLRDTGNLPPGRGGRQGKPWKSFLVTKTMLYCKERKRAVSPFQADFPPAVRCWFNKGWKGLSSCEVVCILLGCNEWRVLFSSAWLNASWSDQSWGKAVRDWHFWYMVNVRLLHDEMLGA